MPIGFTVVIFQEDKRKTPAYYGITKSELMDKRASKNIASGTEVLFMLLSKITLLTVRAAKNTVDIVTYIVTLSVRQMISHVLLIM